MIVVLTGNQKRDRSTVSRRHYGPSAFMRCRPALHAMHWNRATWSANQTLDLAAHQPQHPTERSPDVGQTHHPDDLHACWLEANLRLAVQHVRHQPKWVVEIKIAD